MSSTTFQIVCVLRRNHLVVNDYVVLFGRHVPEKPSSPLTVYSIDFTAPCCAAPITIEDRRELQPLSCM